MELLKFYGIELETPVKHNPKKQLQQFVKKHFEDKKEKIKLLLLTGAFKQCDHLASSGIETIFNLNTNDFQYLHESGYIFYKHQKDACSLSGSAILTAPNRFPEKQKHRSLWLQIK